MTNQNDPKANSVSRRSVLRKGAATGAIIVAGTTVSGSAAADSGGVGYLTSQTGDIFNVDEEGVAFTIGEERVFTMVRSPDCNGDGDEREYQGYFIFGEDDGDQGTLYVDPNRSMPSGEDLYEFQNVVECGEAETLQDGESHRDWDSTWRVNFSPV